MEEMISIIVPVYNAEKTLERCIRSLTGQTYENIEIILVNDGSKDDSLTICRRFAKEDPRIKVIDKPNGGVSSARNAGLDIARGEFVMFCDSDDWAEADWCQTLHQAYRPGMLVMCGCFVEGQQSVLPREIKAKAPYEPYAKKDFCELYLSCFNAPWNKIFRRDVIEDNKLRFDKRIKNGEDYLFNVGYLAVIEGDILFLDRCLHHYSWPTGESLSSKADPEAFEKNCILFDGLMDEVQKFMQPDMLPDSFYSPFFWKFKSTLKDTLDSKMPFSSKYARINEIISREAYQKTVSHAKSLDDGLFGKICRSNTPAWFILWGAASRAVHGGKSK